MWLDQSQVPPKRFQPSLAQFWTYCSVPELLQPKLKDIMMHLDLCNLMRARISHPGWIYLDSRSVNLPINKKYRQSQSQEPIWSHKPTLQQSDPTADRTWPGEMSEYFRSRLKIVRAVCSQLYNAWSSLIGRPRCGPGSASSYFVIWSRPRRYLGLDRIGWWPGQDHHAECNELLQIIGQQARILHSSVGHDQDKVELLLASIRIPHSTGY